MDNTNQKDLVLSMNQFAYVLDETKGIISCLVGPTKFSPSQSDTFVIFDPDTKNFVPCYSDKTKQQCITAPENWYVSLKNPSASGRHPAPGTSNTIPEDILTGKKININGPCNFALYPGQMAKVIKGHTLKKNQYLVARVYDADALNAKVESGEEPPKDTNPPEPYVNGQILIIKNVSFYIPPTGIEIVRGPNGKYERDAVMLDNLEYCIMKDENGTTRIVHGAAVVFPRETEHFVSNEKTNSYIFKAFELSDIVGLYIKVNTDYTDEETGVEHKAGEELFITGKEQNIYFPRVEHSIISYDGRLTHHAIAIPAGEGRYILNRQTGKITTVTGPTMYLPDPRYEVVVRRKLSERECDLWFPDNYDVKQHNNSIAVDSIEIPGDFTFTSMADDGDFLTKSITVSNMTFSNLNESQKIRRSNSYEPPRTITLENKYDGVVAINVWTGYAVKIISKETGKSRICVGPQLVILDYDEILESISLSTGQPKNSDKKLNTVYLRYANNVVSDIIEVTTSDHVNCKIKVSYYVNFRLEDKEKWFDVENYVKFLCDRYKSIFKDEAKGYPIDAFINNYAGILRMRIFGNPYAEETQSDEWSYFPENGMEVSNIEFFFCHILDADTDELLDDCRFKVLKKTFDLSTAASTLAMDLRLEEIKTEKVTQLAAQAMAQKQAEIDLTKKILELETELNRLKEKETLEATEAKIALAEKNQVLNEMKRIEELEDENVLHEKKSLAIDRMNSERDSMGKVITSIFDAISPELAATIQQKNETEIARAVIESTSPYAIAMGDDNSPVDVATRLVRGTAVEDILKKIGGQM